MLLTDSVVEKVDFFSSTMLCCNCMRKGILSMEIWSKAIQFFWVGKKYGKRHTHHAVKVPSFTFQSLLVCDNDTICAKNGGQQWQTFKCLPCRCKKEVFVPDQVINVLFLVWQSQGDGWTCHPQNTPHCKN